MLDYLVNLSTLECTRLFVSSVLTPICDLLVILICIKPDPFAFDGSDLAIRLRIVQIWESYFLSFLVRWHSVLCSRNKEEDAKLIISGTETDVVCTVKKGNGSPREFLTHIYDSKIVQQEGVLSSSPAQKQQRVLLL